MADIATVPSQPPPGAGTQRRLWVLVLGAAFILLLVSGLLLVRQQAFGEIGEMLSRDLDALIHATDRQFVGVEEYLAQCQDRLLRAHGGRVPAELEAVPPLPDPTRLQIPAPVELFWCDDKLHPRGHLLPKASGLIHQPAPPTSHREWQDAAGLPRPLFRVTTPAGGQAQLEVVQPVLTGASQVPAAFVVARFPFATLISGSMRGSFFATYAVSFRQEASGTELARMNNGNPLAPELHASRQLNTRLPGILVASNLYDMTWRQTIKVTMVITVLLALALVIGMVNQNREITRRVAAEAEKDRLITNLTAAINDVHSLKKLLPICMYCKKVRDDNDFWQQIEHYFKAEAGTDFSHGVCPQCYKEVVVPILENARRDADKRTGDKPGRAGSTGH